jgi:hypothetical protein
MVPRSPVVAKNQMIIGVPSYVERHRLNRNAAARPGRIRDYESCRPCRRPWGCAGHQELR